MPDALLPVLVVSGENGQSKEVQLRVPPGTTLRNALEQARATEDFADLRLERCRHGIFGVERPADTVLRAGDRVEIYRPLKVNPREARRRRARARDQD